MKSTTEKVALVVAILIVLLGISFVVGIGVLISKLVNHTKDSITVNQFIEVMEKNDFKVSRASTKFLGPYIKAEDGYIAKKDGYEIEFYTFKDESSAKEFFSQNKAKFDADTSSVRVDFSGKNYSVFTIDTNGRYKFVERVEKTVVLVNVGKDYKKAVENVLDDLGY